MVVELDVKEKPTSLQNTPVGSFKSVSGLTFSPSKPVTNGSVLSTVKPAFVTTSIKQ